MAMSMEKFLYNYFGVLNLAAMPQPVLDRFNSWVKKGDYPNDDIKSWLEKFPRKTDTDKWVSGKDLPAGDPNDLPKWDEIDRFDLDDLYRAFFEVFSKLSKNREYYQDNDKVFGFIDKYFGQNKVFENEPVKSDVKNQLKVLVGLLLGNKFSAIINIKQPQRRVLESLQRNIDKIDDADAQNTIQVLVSDINDNLSRSYYYSGIDPSRVQEAKHILRTNNIDLDQISNGLNQDIIVDGAKIDSFKEKFFDICDTLRSKKAIYEAFKENDDKRIISRQIDAALSKTDYTGKINEKNYVAPKYDKGAKNPEQWIKAKQEELYTSVFKKYLTLHRDNLFMKETASAIFGAIEKEKIKPTDGLKTLIDKSDTIIGNLRGKEPFGAADHLKWLTDKLKLYNDNGMKDDIDGALRWGYQMNRIVTKLIEEAVADGKVEEAKTALNVLSVMQYGTFTGRRLNAINEATKDMHLLNDSGYSWMKKDSPTAFVANAAEGLLGAGIRGVAYGVTGIVNRVRRTGVKFNNKSAVLKTLSDRRAQELIDQKNNDKQKKEDDNRNDRTIIHDNNILAQNAENQMHNWGYNVDNAKQYIDNQENQILRQEKNVRAAQERLSGWESKKDEYEHQKYELQSSKDEYDEQDKIISGRDIDENIAKLEKQVLDVKGKIKGVNDELSKFNASRLFDANGNLITAPIIGPDGNPITDPDVLKAHKDHLAAQQADLYDQLRQLNDSIAQEKSNRNNPARINAAKDRKRQLQDDVDAYNQAELDYQNAEKEYNLAMNAFNVEQDKYNTLSTDAIYTELNKQMGIYSDAITKKEKAEKDIENREKEWNEWDEKNRNDYNDLMAYWDFLQTGNTKNLFHLSTKKLQDKMKDKSKIDPTKTNMDMRFLKWKQQHGYAA